MEEKGPEMWIVPKFEAVFINSSVAFVPLAEAEVHQKDEFVTSLRWIDGQNFLPPARWCFCWWEAHPREAGNFAGRDPGNRWLRSSRAQRRRARPAQALSARPLIPRGPSQKFPASPRRTPSLSEIPTH